MAGKVNRRIDHEGAFRTAFEKNRKRILQTATICPLCGQELDKSIKDKANPLFVEIDHIVPISRGGHPSDIDNLQAVHKICNRKKSNRTLSETITDIRVNQDLRDEQIRCQFSWSDYNGG